MYETISIDLTQAEYLESNCALKKNITVNDLRCQVPSMNEFVIDKNTKVVHVHVVPG